jgi:hypothetical protein
MQTELMTDNVLDGLEQDEAESWCHEDDENPGFFLCGDADDDPLAEWAPRREIPDEVSCSECLAEERRRQTWLYKIGKILKL